LAVLRVARLHSADSCNRKTIQPGMDVRSIADALSHVLL
jgi:hypothetical protein